MTLLKNAVLLTAAFLTALLAGLLFAYSCSVNLGLHRLSDVAYLSAMQEINQAIQNPAFFACFMGPVLLLPFSTWLHFGRPATRLFRCLLAATVLYLAGTFGVTMLGNVPLNEALANFDIAHASPEALMRQRAAFEAPWNSFHLIRTGASMVSLLLILIGILSERFQAKFLPAS